MAGDSQNTPLSVAYIGDERGSTCADNLCRIGRVLVTLSTASRLARQLPKLNRTALASRR